ncbi:MAG: hypothetical protein AAGI70_14215, partial [Pseudomonadota bacterium]
FVEDEAALPSVKARLKAPAAGRLKGSGPVHLVFDVADLGQEVEVVLPGRWQLGPEMNRAIKDTKGVGNVEEF